MGSNECPECPYGAGECPKIHDLEDSVKDVLRQIRQMNNYLMVIMGIIAVECGFVVL